MPNQKNRKRNPQVVQMLKAKGASRRHALRHRAFTMVQLVVSLGILSMIATLLFNALSDGRASARRAQCDARLKTIALALDAQRQEYGFYPASLDELREKHYLHDEDALHCPADIREGGTYGDFYIIRAPRDEGDLPTLVCPFHESQGGSGAQAFKGTYTKQFMARPASLEQASGATVERPGQGPVSAVAGMVLHGGDRIRTTAGGAALIRFFDTSSSELAGNADVTVLESFVSGASGSTLYTIIRQTLGTVVHRVNRGSKFDVATPTATAGALGTAFRITINPNGSGLLTVTESQVYVSTQRNHFIVDTGGTTALNAAPAALQGLTPNPTPTATSVNPTATPIPTATPTAVPTATPIPTATPTPRPTATPTPRPTATPTPRPTPTPTKKPHDDDDDDD